MTELRDQKQCHDSATQHWREIAAHEKDYLHISGGENPSSPVMLSFKPVGIYLPVDVNNVAFLQGELPEEGNKEANKIKHQLSFMSDT